MVKRTKKPNKTITNTINSVPNVPKEHKTPKSRKQIYQENYQKNKEKKKQQQQERYQQNKERIKAQKKVNYAKKKKQEELSAKQIQAKYYQAEAIKILIPFKEYTELNKEKRKLWQDFNWTLKDCQKAIKEGLGDITAIMKLEQVINNLIKDFWETAKSEKRKLSKSWNSLDYDEQQRLIRYWGYEKARVENGYLDEAERLERQSQSYLKDIESAKFHEERGKENCQCSYCEEQRKIRKEVIKEREKIIDEYEKEQKKQGDYETEWVKGDCYNCEETRKVNSDSGLCKKCSNS